MKVIKKVLALQILFFIYFSVYAEGMFSFTKLSVQDGLSNNSVYSIMQDSLGFLWFGTFSGLNRFDGNKIEVYRPEALNPRSISGSLIFDIIEDSNGGIWAATDGGGISYYDVNKNIFKNFLSDKSIENSICSDKIFCIEQAPDGQIWIGTADSGISIYSIKNETFKFISNKNTDGLNSNIIRTIFFDSRGQVWVGTQGGGLSFSKDGENFYSFFKNETVRCIYEDSKGRILVGIDEKGLFLKKREEEINFIQIVKKHSIRAVCEDTTGRIWVGTERNGLLILRSDVVMERITSKSADKYSLSNNFIRDIFVDTSGLVWVGTRGGGLNVYNTQSEKITKQIFSENEPRKIFKDIKNNLWVATDGDGLFRIDKGRVKKINDKYMLPGSHLYSIEEDKNNNLWIGTDGDGLFRINTDTRETVQYQFDPEDENSISSNVIWSLLVDSRGVLWIGTEGGGVNRYDSKTKSFVRIKRTSPTTAPLGNSIREIFEDKEGVLWFGTWDGGLSRMSFTDQEFKTYTRDPNNKYSISDNSVNCIAETEEGGLWIGTSGGGIVYFDKKTEEFTAFQKEDGLSDNNVLGILADKGNYLWISTVNGLNRFDIIKQNFQNFWQSDGLISDEFSRNSFFSDGNGKFYFGNKKGVVSFSSSELVGRNFNPPVRVTGFSVLNEEKTLFDTEKGKRYMEKNIFVTEKINVYPGDIFIGFSFSALDYLCPEKNKYAVCLQGFDKDWHYIETQSKYYYSSLPPGNYQLRVLGTNSNGVWSTESANVEVSVHPAFMQTWNFFVLLFFVISAIGFLIFYFRLKALHSKNEILSNLSNYVQDVREEERKMVARDVHDELGQLLTTLKTHIFWLSNNASSKKEARMSRYESMLGLINLTLEWTKKIASRLRPVILDNLTLAEAIEWVLAETNKHEKIKISWKIEATPHLSVEKSTAIFRVVQEAITNIIRHSEATKVSIVLEVKGVEIIIKIEDDGIGISEDKLASKTSYGIIGMKERVKKFGGVISFEAGLRGTTVLITVPV